MAVSRTIWKRGLDEDRAKLKRAAAIDREERKKEITTKWREGFRALKVENDRLQVESENRYHEDIVDADIMYKQALESGPPKD